MSDLKDRVAARRNAGKDQAEGRQGDSGKQLTPVDRKMADARAMFKKMQGEFASALPRHVGIDRFMRMALTCMRKNPALLDCDPPSVLAALLEAARLGLEPGTKQAAIVPLGKQATFIAQWQGLIELMYRSGQVVSVTAEFVHENDEWDYTIGDGGTFWHRPKLLAEDRGSIVLAYAFATIKGGSRSKIVFLSRPDAEEIRDRYSKNYQRAERNRRNDSDNFARHPEWGKFNSTWHTEFDAMWRKSAVRRLADWVPSSPELRELLMKENEAGEMRDATEALVPDDVFEGEVVSDSTDEGDGESATAAEPEQAAPLEAAQRERVGALLAEIGWGDPPDQARALSALTGRSVASAADLTTDDGAVIDAVAAIARSADPQTLLTDYIAAARAGDHTEMMRLLTTVGGASEGGDADG